MHFKIFSRKGKSTICSSSGGPVSGRLAVSRTHTRDSFLVDLRRKINNLLITWDPVSGTRLRHNFRRFAKENQRLILLVFRRPNIRKVASLPNRPPGQLFRRFAKENQGFAPLPGAQYLEVC